MAIAIVFLYPVYLYTWGSQRKTLNWIWFILGGVFAWIMGLHFVMALAVLTGTL